MKFNVWDKDNNLLTTVNAEDENDAIHTALVDGFGDAAKATEHVAGEGARG